MRSFKKLLTLSCLTTLTAGALQLTSGIEGAFRHTAPEMMRRMSYTAATPVLTANSIQALHSNGVFTPVRFASHKASNTVSIGHPCIDAVFQYGFGRPHVAETFINTILGFEGPNKITEVTFLNRDLPSQNPTDPIAYNFTVDVRCKTQDGRYFLVEMQNDFRDDYHLKALIEHSRMIGRIDLDQHKEDSKTKSADSKNIPSKYWKDIEGIYSIVLTNKAFGKTKKKKTYSEEPVMEPDLLNTYELRNVRHLSRHFGDIPNQLTLMMLANLEDKPIKDLSLVERWASIFQEKELKYGARKIPETKAIEDPDELTAGDEAMKEFLKSLDVRHLPQAVREQYIRTLRYYNDSIADIAEKGKAEGKLEGIAQGKLEEKLEIAKKMIKRGRPLQEIMEDTDLTEAEINALKHSVKK